MEDIKKLLKDVDLSGVDQLPDLEAGLSENAKKFMTFRRAAVAINFTPTFAQLGYLVSSLKLQEDELHRIDQIAIAAQFRDKGQAAVDRVMIQVEQAEKLLDAIDGLMNNDI